jgi:purine-binding chemotaxis protein CheW
MRAKATGINWDEVKNRLVESQLRLEQSVSADPQRLEAVYRRRASQLANRGLALRTVAPTRPVLAFFLGSERYGLELIDLAEVLPFGRCTPLPGAQPELLGVINLQGEVRSVLDLSRLLGLPDTNVSTGGYILMLRQQNLRIGLRVDRVEGIQHIVLAELALASEQDPDSPACLLRGLTPDRLRILSTEAIVQHAFLCSNSESETEKSS